MNRMSRHCSVAALLLGCLLVATGRAQYVEDSIDVGARGVGCLAYNSRADVLYGASEDGVFFAISCDSNKVVGSFPLQHALMVAYDSSDNRAYCTFHDDSLLVVDGVSHARIKSMPMDGATVPVWDPVSDRVYVSCQSSNSVAVVDCATDSLLTNIPVGAAPIEMYINTTRHKLYVLNYDAGTASIVDLATNQVIKTVDVGGNTSTGYYCRVADKFYGGGAFRQCIVIGGQSDSVVADITLPGNVGVISATGNEDAGLVYLGTSSGSDDYVATVLTQSDSILATTIIGLEPFGLACSGRSGFLYCASAITDEVRVLAGDGGQILNTLQVGDYPYVFAVVPRHDRVYLGHLNGTYVYVIRDTAAGIAETDAGGGFAGRDVASTLVRGRLLLASDVQEANLVDLAGSVRMALHAGDNDVSRLAPGVYFVLGAQAQAQAARKVIVRR